jgi:hypothetical protein
MSELLVVTEVGERLSVSKEAAQKFESYPKKVNNVKVIKELY